MTLTGHSKEVLYLAFDKDICVSIARDQTMVLQRFDEDTKKTTVIDQVQEGNINEKSVVAVHKIEGVGKELDKIFIAITDQDGLRVICRQKINKDYVVNEE